jgi:hypothetical protein
MYDPATGGMPGMGAGDPYAMGGYGGMPGMGGMPGGMMPGDPGMGAYVDPGMMGGYGGMPGMGAGDPYAMGGYGGMPGMGAGDPYAMAMGGYGGMMPGDPGMGAYVDPGMMGDPMFYDPAFDPAYQDPGMVAYVDPAYYQDPGMGAYVDPANPYTPPALEFLANETRGTESWDDINALSNNYTITGLGGGDNLWSTGYQNVTFNYESVDLGALRNEAFMDKINAGWMDFGNPAQFYNGVNIGLKNTDRLRFEGDGSPQMNLHYGSTDLDAAGSNTVMSLNSSNLNFTGNGGGGVLGDVCLFDAGNFVGGQAGNVILAIDSDGNGTADNDIYFDVSDDITQMTYDVTIDAFTFS